MKQKYFYLLILFLFVFRVIYGLFAEFWFCDEIQIYLIGLKSYTTGSWPFYGPDIVYTNTQIPGALQGLLVSIPFYLLKIPESPTIFLNILSFGSLSFLAYFISKRVPAIPAWIVWTLVLTTPWTLCYSTRVVNPSYVLVFSVPFFLSIIELLPIYSRKIINPKPAFFIIGLTTTCIMQLHLSYILLLPFTILVFAESFRKSRRKTMIFLLLYLSGFLLGLSTLAPTLISPDPVMKGAASNIVFNPGNFKNILTILVRFLSFAGFEIPYMLGGGTAERLNVIKNQPWMAPFTLVLLVTGFLQVILFVLAFFMNREKDEWQKIKWLTFVSWLIIFISFFFSIKGPSSHTFYLMLPIPVIYSFYCYQWLISKKPVMMRYLKIIVICGLFFHAGLGTDNYRHRSLYLNRAKVQEALDKMDYRILGPRRADTLGYGY
ncbi:MAG: hypothetical protein WCK34_14535 [Bacteroidota bacterium]